MWIPVPVALQGHEAPDRKREALKTEQNDENENACFPEKQTVQSASFAGRFKPLP
jgi:hypothetical protein